MVGECQALVLEFLISFSLVNSKRYYFFYSGNILFVATFFIVVIGVDRSQRQLSVLYF